MSFSKEGKEGVNYNDFMKSLLGAMNEHRRKLMDGLFAKIDTDNDNIIQIDDIKDRFNPKGHPEVLSNKKTTNQIYTEFIESIALFHTLSVTPLFTYNINRQEERLVLYLTKTSLISSQ